MHRVPGEQTVHSVAMVASIDDRESEQPGLRIASAAVYFTNGLIDFDGRMIGLFRHILQGLMNALIGPMLLGMANEILFTGRIIDAFQALFNVLWANLFHCFYSSLCSQVIQLSSAGH
jgi:hypothetical protein